MSYHGDDGRTVFVPLTLRLTVIVCIVYATATVVFAALENLKVGGSNDPSITAMLVISTMHFLVPLLISTSIVTDRPVSRPLLVLFSAAVTYRALENTILTSATPTNLAYAAAMISFFLSVVWWLYRSKRVAFYFFLISGTSIPQELLKQREALSRPTLMERKISIAASGMTGYLEYVAVAITLAMAILVFRWLSSPGY